MNLIHKLLFTILIIQNATGDTILEENVAVLTSNFFANLQEDPQIKDQNLTESSKMFIDKLVTQYVDLMRYAIGASKHVVNRRSLPVYDIDTLTQDFEGMYMLSGYKQLFNIKVKYPRDIVMFYLDYDGYKQWYAIALDGEHQKQAKTMAIYKLKKLEFEKILAIQVQNGTKVAFHPTEQAILIVVAEYNSLKECTLCKGISVYEFNKNEELNKIQTLNVQYATDVELWTDDYNIFLMVAQHMINDANKTSYEINIPVYKWLGQHFDVIQEIQTYGAKSVTLFTIGKSQFIAVANYKDNRENTHIYSEIFKYDLHNGRFKTHQKILTNAAVDVKHFYFTSNNIREHFLIFANLYEIDAEHSHNYETHSIVYKYIEGYFMPFQSFKINAATELLPIMGNNNEFVLLVACKYEGIKAFQYNGWKFEESIVQYTTGVFANGVASMHSYQFNNKTILTIASENDYGSSTNVFEVIFKHQNDLSQFQDSMLKWCKDTTKTIQNIITRPMQSSKINKIQPTLQHKRSHILNRDAENLNQTDIDEGNKHLSHFKEVIQNQSKKLDAIEKQVETSLLVNKTNTIVGTINLRRLTINNNLSYFNTINTTFINSINVTDVLENVININDGFAIKNKLEIEEVQFENQFMPKFINDQSAASVLHNDVEYKGQLIVNGTVTIDQLKVNGTVNGINFNTDNILLNSKNQVLTNLQAKTIKIQHLNTATNVNNLSAKKVIVKGFVNDVDIETLDRFALRKHGSQIITGEYFFNKLHVENLATTKISNKYIPDDLILIKDGEYEIPQVVELTQDLTTNNLWITERLNDISATNRTLDVLLSDAQHVQHIKGIKIFENLQLQNPISLQGKISSSKLDKMNPVSIVDEEVVLTGDYYITGNVSIEGNIVSNDIQTTSQALGVQKLWNKGIKLIEQMIPVHLDFQQQLHINELVADKINDIKVNSLLVTGLKEPQIISGWKTFPKDLHILGSTIVTNMNGINLQEFEHNILKTVGNQTLRGKHHFQSIIANRIYNTQSQVGNHLWEDVMTTNTDQNINGTTIIAANTVQCNSLQTKTLNSLHINGYDFNALVNDTVLKGQEREILGYKTFPAMTVQNMVVHTLDMNRVPTIIENSKATFIIEDSINLPNNIYIENIFFTDSFNGIASENFGHPWMFSESEQIIQSDQNFENLIIHGKLFIESGFINDENIIQISENSVKIDEPFHFETVTFAKGVSSIQGISLEGKFESLYLHDIVQSNTREQQIITGKIVFNNNVTIYGEVNFNGLVSGMNISNLCKFALSTTSNDGPYSLFVKGNAYFANGPVIQHINTLPIKYILEKAWFQNQDTHLTGSFHFDEAIFNQQLTVDGLIDGVKPQDVFEIYFSKTRDQNITVPLNVDNNVIFKNGVYAPEAKVEGTVSGWNLEEFIHTAILDGYDQVFETTMLLETCEVQDLRGEYRVNGLNLESDVMRYDQPNIVTGKKLIQNVETKTMTLNHKIKIQNTELLLWMQNAVLKEGTFSIAGETVLYNNTNFLSHVTAQGYVNRRIFNQDTIMLKSIPQTISGHKIISSKARFESIKLKGLLNGFDLTDFLYNQAYKNQDILFKSPIYINADIAAQNVNIEKAYQGINVSRLMHNLTRFATIENYQEHYEKLLNISTQIQNSLLAQAYFLHHYEEKQIYTNVYATIPVTFQNSNDQYLACINKGNKNYTISFQIWNKEKQEFQCASDIEDINIPLELHYIQKIQFQGNERWYIEHKNIDVNETQLDATIYEITRNGLKEISPTIQHNGAQTVTTLTLPQQNISCIFLVFSQNSQLYCEKRTDQNASLELEQTFETNNTIEAASKQIQDSLYIFIINKGIFFDEGSIDIWKYDATTGKFNVDQQIYTLSPNSIKTAYYKETGYLVVASGQIQNSKHLGLLNIYKYNKNNKQFETYQRIDVHAPTQAQFVELPTRELVLYVITENPTEPFIVYEYQGISGFQPKSVISTVLKSTKIESFTAPNNQHFVLLQNRDETQILEGVFKGVKV